MNLTIAKKVISLTNKFIDSNYFFDNDSIETQKRNRDYAASMGQDVSKYTDSFIVFCVKGNSLRRSVRHTALPLFNAIKTNDKKYLCEHIRYDQKYTKELFELFTGLKVPQSNYQIKEFINANF